MRKVSKSRTDDDVISSTNGSVLNDDGADSESTAELKDPDADTNDENETKNNEVSNVSKVSSKRNKSKGRPNKRKSEKIDKAEEEEYEVEKILDSKKIKGKLHFLIRWKGYTADSDTWEPENTLSCPELINKFNEEKENSKTKQSKATDKKNNKRKAKKDNAKKPTKKARNEWDSEDADENAEYEVDRILEVHHKKNGQREFLIHWKGWSSKFDSWEPESNLNCSELIQRFMDKVSNARSTDTRNLRVAPETTNRFTLQDPTSGRRLSKRRGQRQRVRYDNAE